MQISETDCLTLPDCYAVNITKAENERRTNMENKALVVIDLQNDITKNYKLIIDKVNSAVDWASEKDMYKYYVNKGCEVLTLAEC